MKDWINDIPEGLQITLGIPLFFFLTGVAITLVVKFWMVVIG